jgi:hypothetical protein
MPKVDEWRKKVDDWKAVLNQPKNLALKAGGTGVSESLRKVADAEMDFDKAKDLARGQIAAASNDLQAALTDLITTCKGVSDKHGRVFTAACKHLDAIREAAASRRSEAAREVDQIRHGVGERCGTAIQHLKAARTMQELGTAWHAFVQDFESHGKGFPSLRPHIATVKGHNVPDPNAKLDQQRPVFLKLAQACQGATVSR